jgi:hypothetical protein
MLNSIELIVVLLSAIICSSCCLATDQVAALLPNATIVVPPVQIAFGVMIYQKPGRSVDAVLRDFHSLMEVVYTANNHLYVLHVDVKSDPALIARYVWYVLTLHPYFSLPHLTSLPVALYSCLSASL